MSEKKPTKASSDGSSCRTVFLSACMALLLAGCAVPTQFAVQNPRPEPQRIVADNRVQLKRVAFVGELCERTKDVEPRFMSGFMKAGSEIRLTPETGFNDGQLDVSINSDFSPTLGTRLKYIPLFGQNRQLAIGSPQP